MTVWCNLVKFISPGLMCVSHRLPYIFPLLSRTCRCRALAWMWQTVCDRATGNWEARLHFHKMTQTGSEGTMRHLLLSQRNMMFSPINLRKSLCNTRYLKMRYICIEGESITLIYRLSFSLVLMGTQLESYFQFLSIGEYQHRVVRGTQLGTAGILSCSEQNMVTRN